MRYDWDAMFSLWIPADDAQKVVGTEIDDVLRALEFILEKECKLEPFHLDGNPLGVIVQIKRDGFLNSYDLIQHLLEQGKCHRRFWFCHLQEANRKTFETGIVAPKHNEMRYVKIQLFGKGNSWKNPSAIKEFRICYHQSKFCNVEVVYEEQH